MFKKIAIVGVGLIGGSIGLAVKKKKLAKEVIGVARRESSKDKALKFKAVDKATLNLREAVKDAELVILATPVAKIVEMAKDVIKCAQGGLILTDVGSTKELIVKEIERIAPSNVKFVGAHPMAGSEKSGVKFADSKLFNNSICIITKTKKTDDGAFNKVKTFWTKIGATCEILSPDKHDRYISFVSHLPHVAAVALTIAAETDSLKYVSSGFKDTTRIASSNPNLWKDIFESNKEALLSSLHEYRAALEGIERSIKMGDSKTLIEHLEKAKKIRDKIK
ncbi:MAG: prephenate dehydrogenase [Candidatus Omnitrophota bacterium]|nr:MAG: prephenate dehydrogenase [Candidatus Omnitrophota bacterium]